LKNKKLIEISDYIDRIKENAFSDIAHIQNNVLNKNPHTSEFIDNCLVDSKIKKLNLLFLFNKISIFYIRSIARLVILVIQYGIFKIFGKKVNFSFDKEIYIVDIFFLVDKILKEGEHKDVYFPGLYEVLEKHNKEYIFLPRLYGLGNNPIKFIKLLKVLYKEKKNKYLFEYDFLKFFDFVRIFIFIMRYPIKQFDLIQNGNAYLDNLFNYELFNCLPNTSFEPFVRYIVGERLAKRLSRNSKIISWQEFQNLEKTFYKAIRSSNNKILIYGCEFLIKYELYLSMHITNIDESLLIVPHKTLLNGNYNYSSSNKHHFQNGVSLRYKNIFRFENSFNHNENSLVLLAQDVNKSKNLLKIIGDIDTLSIKLHPASNQEDFNQFLKVNWNYVNLNLYDLFKNTNIIFVSTMTGTALEAVACGISVIVVASPNSLKINPLVEYGYGKIWDIVDHQGDLKIKMNSLLEFRKKNENEILFISKWYKDNFFIEPTEKNISKAFEL
jgi:hypothetical protein